MLTQQTVTTAAAIERVVHHSTILEFKVSSYRSQQARNRVGKPAGESLDTRSSADV